MYRIVMNHKGECMIQKKGWFFWSYLCGGGGGGMVEVISTWPSEEDAEKWINEKVIERKDSWFQIIKENDSYHVRKRWLIFWINDDKVFSTAQEAETYIEELLEEL